MKENAVALSNETKTIIILLRRGEYCQIIPSTLSQDYLTIITSPSVNSCQIWGCSTQKVHLFKLEENKRVLISQVVVQNRVRKTAILCPYKGLVVELRGKSREK